MACVASLAYDLLLSNGRIAGANKFGLRLMRGRSPYGMVNFDLRQLRTMMKQVIPETPPEYDQARIVKRPDGFYWQSSDGGKESGPFATLLEAVEDMQYSADSDFEPGESVEQAEAEIGVADWVDPVTGEPAEDQSPRIEDH